MPKTTLIIEDDQFTREMYTRQFEKSGYQVISTSEGDQGLKSIFEKKPNFVLLDIMLPKMDGVTLLEKLRQKEKEAKQPPIPVILLTNLGQESVLDRCLKLGITGLLIKSRFTPIEIVKKVESLLSGREESNSN
jgi:two-component system alkaline phosphatase synthesis response regulator PhoP